MNTAETAGPGRIWLFVPALWLLVGMAGFVALSHWPELFAQPPRVDRTPVAAELPGPRDNTIPIEEMGARPAPNHEWTGGH